MIPIACKITNFSLYLYIVLPYNIIVYNLSETSEQSPEDQNFANLICSAIFKVDINVQMMFCIRCKDSDRVRPLLGKCTLFLKSKIGSSL